MTGFLGLKPNGFNSLPKSSPSKVVTVNLQNKVKKIEAEGYKYVYAILTWGNKPIGEITLPIKNGICRVDEYIDEIIANYSHKIFGVLLYNHLTINKATKTSLDNLLSVNDNTKIIEFFISIIVCTRERPEQLENVLLTLIELDYSNYEIIIIDNAPSTDRTHNLVKSFAEVKYFVEPTKGLNHARNRGLKEASGSIIAYTDDDCMPDLEWLKSINISFHENPELACTTGLIYPYELITNSQLDFESLGGFNRGFVREYSKAIFKGKTRHYFHLGAGRYGAGANMAFKKNILKTIQGFDPALDVGTPTGGGGDLEIFFRIQQEGYTLQYMPMIKIRHQHRKKPLSLLKQIETWGRATSGYMTSIALRYPQLRFKVFEFTVKWFIQFYFNPFLKASFAKERVSKDLRLAPLKSYFKGPFLYFKSKRINGTIPKLGKKEKKEVTKNLVHSKVIHLNLSSYIPKHYETSDYSATYFYVHVNDLYLGRIIIQNEGRNIYKDEVLYKISHNLTYPLLNAVIAEFKDDEANHKYHLKKVFEKQICLDKNPANSCPPKSSIILCTLDRPKQLERCLNSIKEFVDLTKHELIVVDNNPSSQQTRPIVEKFKNIKYVTETVKGLSRARNTGIKSSLGEIIVTTDDDVIVTAKWLETLLEPFEYAHISAVAGNIIPLEFTTIEQEKFEIYGGLSKGWESFIVDGEWLRSGRFKPPETWKLGATANFAIRRSEIFNRNINLFDESLGPGTPTGVGEDTLLFYRLLKSNNSIKYRADSVVKHEHRKSKKDLKNQIYNYSKGHVCYLLTTAKKENDHRAYYRILYLYYFWTRELLLNKSNRGLSLIGLKGHLIGPISLIKSKIQQKKINGKVYN